MDWFSVPTMNLSAITLLAQDFKNKGLDGAFALSPDKGAIKLAEEADKVLGGGCGWLRKERDRYTGEIQVEEKRLNVEGKDVIVFDDIISTGGTIARAIKMLKSQGARRVFASCVHPLLIGEAKTKIMNAGAEEIVGTDSIPSTVRQVSLAPLDCGGIVSQIGAKYVEKLFFLISGEHETLPVSEVEAILKAEGHSYKITEKLTQVLRFEANTNCVDSNQNKVSHDPHLLQRNLSIANATVEEIVDNIRSFVSKFINSESFAARVRRIKGTAREIDRVWLEGEIGGPTILETVSSSKVDLSNPQKTFFGVLTDNRFVFGLKNCGNQP